MKAALRYLWNSRTTVFGYLQVVLGVLAATDGIFSSKALKIIILCNGLLTALLGHYNNLKLRQAAAANVDRPAP